MIDKMEPSIWGMAVCNGAALMFAITVTLAFGLDAMSFIR
jgi:hypothetical protein